MKVTTLDIEAGDQRRYPPPGRCIYCLADDVELTDEHVVPYALTGNAVIFEEASCKACAAAISQYEGKVLQGAVGRQRQLLDTPTRRRKNRSDQIDHVFKLLAPTGEEIQTVIHRLPWNESILAHTGWIAPLPGILEGRSPTVTVLGKPWFDVDQTRHAKVAGQVQAQTGHRGPIAFHVGDVHQGSLLRFMAKTAHAYATAHLGLEAFKPLLTDLILGRSNDLNHLVGGPDAPEPGGDTNAFEVRFGEATSGDQTYLLVWLRMFGLLGGPAYVVVAGEIVPGTVASSTGSA